MKSLSPYWMRVGKSQVVAVEFFDFAERVFVAGELGGIAVAAGDGEAAFERGAAEHGGEGGFALGLSGGRVIGEAVIERMRRKQE